MIEAYWDYVTDERGEKVTQPSGGGEMHYLMEIEQRYYDEDISAQQAETTDKLRSTVENQSDEYTPKGHEDVLTRDKI
jgi:hypothetical protein